MNKMFAFGLLLLFVACNHTPDNSPDQVSASSNNSSQVSEEINTPRQLPDNHPKTVDYHIVSRLWERTTQENHDEKLSVPSTSQTEDYSTGEKSVLEFLSAKVPSQNIVIDPSAFNTIVGLHGTRLAISPGMFTLDDSSVYSGNVNIEFREVLDPLAMVMTNITTTANNQLLESAGMVYWNATTEDGQQLKMDDGATASLTFMSSSAENNQGYQLFTGNIQNGTMNWNIFPTLRASSCIAILADGSISFKQYKCHYQKNKVSRGYAKSWNKRIAALQSGKYAGTQLSSREFQQRLSVIRWMGYDMELLDSYLNHPNDLRAGDSLALVQIMKYNDDIRLSNYTTSHKIYAQGYGKKKWVKNLTESFSYLFKESIYYVDEVFVSKNELSRKDELNKKLPPDYAAWVKRGFTFHYHLDGAHKLSKHLVTRPTSMQDINQPDFSGNMITLNVPQMGYINCDRFPQIREKENVYITLNGESTFDRVASFLVFKDINSVMPAVAYGRDFTFTNVPNGFHLTWICIAEKDCHTYFASKDIAVKGETRTESSVSAMSKEKIEEEIKKICL